MMYTILDWHRYNTLLFASSVPLRTENFCLYYHAFSCHLHNDLFGFNQPICHQLEDIMDSVFLNQVMILMFCIFKSLIDTDMTYIILAPCAVKNLICLYKCNI